MWWFDAPWWNYRLGSLLHFCHHISTCSCYFLLLHPHCLQHRKTRCNIECAETHSQIIKFVILLIFNWDDQSLAGDIQHIADVPDSRLDLVFVPGCCVGYFPGRANSFPHDNNQILRNYTFCVFLWVDHICGEKANPKDQLPPRKKKKSAVQSKSGKGFKSAWDEY